MQLGKEYNVPILLPKENIEEYWPEVLNKLQNEDYILIDRFHTIEKPDMEADQWMDFYTHLIKELKPGVTVLLIHLGIDNDELRAAIGEEIGWGWAWRQRDLNVFTNDTIKQLIKENDIKLITWREIGQLLVQ